jgi:hypothetical protein
MDFLETLAASQFVSSSLIPKLVRKDIPRPAKVAIRAFSVFSKRRGIFKSA